MIHLALYRVHPDRLDRLRAWMAELNERAAEVRQTFEREGVRHESAYLLFDAEGPILAYAVECEDYDRARRVFEESPLPIDEQHAAVMREVMAEPIDAELLYACDRQPGRDDRT